MGLGWYLDLVHTDESGDGNYLSIQIEKSSLLEDYPGRLCRRCALRSVDSGNGALLSGKLHAQLLVIGQLQFRNTAGAGDVSFFQARNLPNGEQKVLRLWRNGIDRAQRISEKGFSKKDFWLLGTCANRNNSHPRRLMYRCEAVSIPAFIQQLAVAYIGRGYRFYVASCIPLEKDVHAIDQKLIQLYHLDCSKYVRFRQQKRGEAKVQYLRYRRFFVLIATAGDHLFREREPLAEDIRRRPIQCFGYSVGCYSGRDGKWHPSVRIDRDLFKMTRLSFEQKAQRWDVNEGEAAFYGLHFEPYAPIRRQLIHLLRFINKKRKAASLPILANGCLRLRRSSVMAFARK